MLCKNCGTSNPSDNRYCRNCGTALPFAKETSQHSYYFTNPNLPSVDPSLAEAQLRPELSQKLEEASPKQGNNPFCYVHLMGQNYALSSADDLQELLLQKWIREDTPAYHHETGRWYEANRFPGLDQGLHKRDSGSHPTAAAVDDMTLAAQYGKEAETAAAEGNLDRAITLYEKIVSLKVRYPLLRKRLKELKKMKESGVYLPPSPRGQENSDPSLPWIPFHAPEKPRSLFTDGDRSFFEVDPHHAGNASPGKGSGSSPFERKPGYSISSHAHQQAPAQKRKTTSPFQSMRDSHTTDTSPQIKSVGSKPGALPLSTMPNDNEASSGAAPFGSEEGTHIDPEILHLSSGKIPVLPSSSEKLSQDRESVLWTSDFGKEGASTEENVNPYQQTALSDHDTPHGLHSDSLKQSPPPLPSDFEEEATTFDYIEPEKLREFDLLMRQKEENARNANPQNVFSLRPTVDAFPLASGPNVIQSLQRVPLPSPIADSLVVGGKTLCCLSEQRTRLTIFELPSLQLLGELTQQRPVKTLSGNEDTLALLQEGASDIQLYSLPSLEETVSLSTGLQPEDFVVLDGGKLAVVDSTTAHLVLYDLSTREQLEQLRISEKPIRLLRHEDLLLVFHENQTHVTQILF